LGTTPERWAVNCYMHLKWTADTSILHRAESLRCCFHSTFCACLDAANVSNISLDSSCSCACKSKKRGRNINNAPSSKKNSNYTFRKCALSYFEKNSVQTFSASCPTGFLTIYRETLVEVELWLSV
jgi:hypothetical protein